MTRLLDIDISGTGRDADLAELEAQVEGADALVAWARAERAEGRLAFLDVPLDPTAAEEVKAWCAAAPAARDVVLTGMGGSALGARVFDALRLAREDGPHLHVLDTVDPDPIKHLLRTLDPAGTILIGVSKSGSTLETMATFSVFEAWLQDALGADVATRIAVVCGPGSSPLADRAASAGYARFSIPDAVGGRYSALTPAGLLAATCVGVSPLRLLEGARELREQCLDASIGANPALALAVLHHHQHRRGRKTCVLWPYGERLATLGPWWAQLLGESLGKRGPDGPEGVTPLAARGPADQHSLLQLLVEGPDDKFVVFVEAPPGTGPIVPGDASPGAGHALGEIIAAQLEATRFALWSAERPSITVRLAAVDAASIGGFLLAYEMATVYWARLLGVDPFGQPGVELGKRAARARLTGEPMDPNGGTPNDT